MAPSDSEDDGLEDIEDDGEDDGDQDIEDEILDAVADDATEEGDDVCFRLSSMSGSCLTTCSAFSRNLLQRTRMIIPTMTTRRILTPPRRFQSKNPPLLNPSPARVGPPRDPRPSRVKVSLGCLPPKISSNDLSKASSPAPLTRKRSLSPAQARKRALMLPMGSFPRTFIVEAICALPHPVPTHSLASSQCMTHLLTGSDDGYIRDYDIFTALNGKNFLTAPQRHHSAVVEGIMKSGQLRFWWENPSPPDPSRLHVFGEEENPLSPVYSLAMHSDALWTLAGTDVCLLIVKWSHD